MKNSRATPRSKPPVCESNPLSFIVALARAALRLPWLYFVRGGWRDGWRGAYVCTASALYPAVVAFKALRPR